MNNVKVFVYFNLHRKCWSVKALSGADRGRVIAHTDGIVLRDIEFKVSEAGRQRVLKEQRKNVHAGVVGYVVDDASSLTMCEQYGNAVTYNPYKHHKFFYKKTGVDADASIHYAVGMTVKNKIPAVFAL